MRNRPGIGRWNRLAVWPVLGLCAALLLLSGCSMVAALPGPGGLALIVAALLAWGGASLGHLGLRGAEAAPLASSAIHGAAQTAPEKATAIEVGGDGAADAAMSLWMDRTLFDAARRQAGYTVFEPRARSSNSGADAGAAAVPATMPPVAIQGDGFADGPDFIRVADEPKKFVNPKAGDTEAIDQGGITFNTRCGTYCHGGQAVGGGCPSLVDEYWIHGDSDLDIYRTIAGGGGKGTRMGAFGGDLSADQIWEVIAYLRWRGHQYLMEKAGPHSYREKGEKCPNEIVLTLNIAGNRTLQGVLKVEDKKSVTVEDRSGELPTQTMVKKDRILDAKVSCKE